MSDHPNNYIDIHTDSYCAIWDEESWTVCRFNADAAWLWDDIATGLTLEKAEQELRSMSSGALTYVLTDSEHNAHKFDKYTAAHNIARLIALGCCVVIKESRNE